MTHDLSFTALIVDDDPAIRQSLRLCLEADNARVQQAATAAGALDVLDRSRFDVIFLDLWLGAESGLSVLPEILRRQPGAGVIVVTAYATYESAVEAMKLGAVDYLPKPFTPAQVRTAARRVVTAGILRRRLSELQDRLDEAEGETSFETSSPAYAAFLQTAARAAASDAVVLLRGESGTGKTVLARWIRRQSRRRDGPFVTVHCPLLSNELMSSVLFGHKKGAFTGAVADAVGKVEEAEGGTLFLDEVGDLTPDAQAIAGEQLRLAGEVRDTINRSYAAGNRPLIDVLDAQRNYRETYRLYITSRAELGRAVMNYSATLGKEVTP